MLLASASYQTVDIERRVPLVDLGELARRRFSVAGRGLEFDVVRRCRAVAEIMRRDSRVVFLR